MRREDLVAAIQALESGSIPQIDPENTSAFSIGGLYTNANITPDALQRVLSSLVTEDAAVFKRALEAYDNQERAWLGFKIVTDPVKAVDSNDTAVVNIVGRGKGSYDGVPAIFLVIDEDDDRETAQIVATRPYSHRDRFQMLDITRGPRMHGEQYEGVAWVAEPLFPEDRLIVLGASPVGAELALLARHLGFYVVAIDDDATYLNQDRFPRAKRLLVDSYDSLPGWQLGEHDYVCVLTRGHMHDPEALAWGVTQGAGYVGMMGHPVKNARVFDLCEQRGIPREKLEATHTPIGLKFGAKTPAELAVSISAELIQVRHERVKAAAAAAGRA